MPKPDPTPASPDDLPPPPRDEADLLEILTLLIETGRARTTADLLKYASQYGAPEAEELLRKYEAEGIPVGLAFDAISVHLRMLAHRRSSALLAECRGQRIGLILPMPPHVPNLFLPVAEVTFLQPNEESAHGHHHEFSSRAIKGARACRAATQGLSALVFEAYREGGELLADVDSAEVLEPRMLPASIRLIAHLRPHRNPGDVPIHATTPVAFI